MSLSPKVPAGGSAVGQAALGGASSAGTALTGMGANLFGQGTGNLNQAAGYFKTLASGNRSAQTQALTPDIENINSVYSGTANSIGKFLRGPSRDTQLAELERQRAGQIGQLYGGARAGANASLAQIGGGETNAGVSATGTGGSILGNVAKTSQDALIAQNQEQQQAGAGFGGLLFNVLKSFTPLGLIGAR